MHCGGGGGWLRIAAVAVNYTSSELFRAVYFPSDLFFALPKPHSSWPCTFVATQHGAITRKKSIEKSGRRRSRKWTNVLHNPTPPHPIFFFSPRRKKNTKKVLHTPQSKTPLPPFPYLHPPLPLSPPFSPPKIHFDENLVVVGKTLARGWILFGGGLEETLPPRPPTPGRGGGGIYLDEILVQGYFGRKEGRGGGGF